MAEFFIALSILFSGAAGYQLGSNNSDNKVKIKIVQKEKKVNKKRVKYKKLHRFFHHKVWSMRVCAKSCKYSGSKMESFSLRTGDCVCQKNQE